MRNILLELEYDGTAYCGWQRQAGQPSIQQTLEETIERVTGEKTVLHGSGRTDTGVHAVRQIANFHTARKLPEWQIQRALNAYLPPDISVRRCIAVPMKFNARFDAKAKRYVYAVRATRGAPPLGRMYFHWTPYQLDLARMRAGAKHFLGTHDFDAFADSRRKTRSTRRTIKSFHILARRDRFLFVVESDGFLMYQVRSMVGTLIEVGRGKMAPERIRAILEAKDRRKAGPTAPAHGLFLLRVKYKKAGL